MVLNASFFIDQAVCNYICYTLAIEYGFAVDYIYKRLYVTTYTFKDSTGTVQVCDFKGTKISTITTGLKRPTKIVLQPSNG